MKSQKNPHWNQHFSYRGKVCQSLSPKLAKLGTGEAFYQDVPGSRYVTLWKANIYCSYGKLQVIYRGLFQTKCVFLYLCWFTIWLVSELFHEIQCLFVMQWQKISHKKVVSHYSLRGCFCFSAAGFWAAWHVMLVSKTLVVGLECLEAA